MRFSNLPIALCLVATSALAQESAPSPTPPPLSMHEAIALGLEHAFGARIAAYNAEVARDQMGQARTAYLPDLSATLADTAYSQQSPNPNYLVSGSLPNSFYTQEETENVDANYLLLSSTRNLDYRAARFTWGSKQAAADAARRQVIRDVATAYLQVVQADALRKLSEQDVARKSRGLEEAKALVKAGRRADYEVTRAEADLATAEASRVDARNGVRLARAALAQTAGTSLPLDFTAEESPAPPVDPRATPSGIPSDQLTQAVDRRDEVRSAEADAEASHLAALREDRLFIPTLTLFGHYSRLVSPTVFDPYLETYTWGGQLQVKFSDLAVNVWRTRAARNTARAARVTADQTRVQVSLNLQRAALEVDRATEVLAANRKALEASRKNFESVEERYRLGVASQTEKIDAESTLVGSEVDTAKADVAWRTAIWSLRYEMGESLDY